MSRWGGGERPIMLALSRLTRCPIVVRPQGGDVDGGRQAGGDRDRGVLPDSDAALAAPVVDVLQPWGTSKVRAHSIVPILGRFHDRVVQVLHPWHRRWSGVPMTWAAVAERVGLERDELWSRPTATEFADPAAERFVTPSFVLDLASREVLVELLGAATTTPDEVRYLFWEGYGLGWPGAAYIELQHRGCYLLAGPLVALPLAPHGDERWLEAVQMCWPQDLAWALGGDTDLPFTYVAGPEPLLRAIDADPRIETGWVAATEPVGTVDA
jgi:hypothetical protein